MNDQPIDRAAAANAADPTVVMPLITFIETWKPLWLGSEPRVFWRELMPSSEPSLARFASQWRRGPWGIFNSETYEKVRALPNNYFTLDEKPGVTFCRRSFKDSHAREADKEAIRALRGVA